MTNIKNIAVERPDEEDLSNLVVCASTRQKTLFDARRRPFRQSRACSATTLIVNQHISVPHFASIRDDAAWSTRVMDATARAGSKVTISSRDQSRRGGHAQGLQLFPGAFLRWEARTLISTDPLCIISGRVIRHGLMPRWSAVAPLAPGRDIGPETGGASERLTASRHSTAGRGVVGDIGEPANSVHRHTNALTAGGLRVRVALPDPQMIGLPADGPLEAV